MLRKMAGTSKTDYAISEERLKIKRKEEANSKGGDLPPCREGAACRPQCRDVGTQRQTRPQQILTHPKNGESKPTSPMERSTPYSTGGSINWCHISGKHLVMCQTALNRATETLHKGVMRKMSRAMCVS